MTLEGGLGQSKQCIRLNPIQPPIGSGCSLIKITALPLPPELPEGGMAAQLFKGSFLNGADGSFGNAQKGSDLLLAKQPALVLWAAWADPHSPLAGRRTSGGAFGASFPFPFLRQGQSRRALALAGRLPDLLARLIGERRDPLGASARQMDAGLADQSLKAGKPVIEQAFNNSFSSHTLTTLDRS